MTAQLSLFGARAAAVQIPPAVPSIYPDPQPCAVCLVLRPIVARRRNVLDVVEDLCVDCTAAAVRARRARGEHVPPGFEWVP